MCMTVCIMCVMPSEDPMDRYWNSTFNPKQSSHQDEETWKKTKSQPGIEP